VQLVRRGSLGVNGSASCGIDARHHRPEIAYESSEAGLEAEGIWKRSSRSERSSAGDWQPRCFTSPHGPKLAYRIETRENPLP